MLIFKFQQRKHRSCLCLLGIIVLRMTENNQSNSLSKIPLSQRKQNSIQYLLQISPGNKDNKEKLNNLLKSKLHLEETEEEMHMKQLESKTNKYLSHNSFHHTMQMFMKEHKANEAIRSEPKLKIPIEDQSSRNKNFQYYLCQTESKLSTQKPNDLNLHSNLEMMLDVIQHAYVYGDKDVVEKTKSFINRIN